MRRVVTEHVSRPHGEKVRHKRDVSSVPRVTAPSRNCTNSHPKDRLSFGYCGPVIRVIVGAQLIGREVYDIQQRAAPRLGAAAVERELHRETVALARAYWPKQIAHDAIAFDREAAMEQPAQYAVPVPLSLYISAPGTGRYERDARSASASSLRRAQFTLQSLKGNSSVHICAAANRKIAPALTVRTDYLSVSVRASPAISLRRQMETFCERQRIRHLGLQMSDSPYANGMESGARAFTSG